MELGAKRGWAGNVAVGVVGGRWVARNAPRAVTLLWVAGVLLAKVAGVIG